MTRLVVAEPLALAPTVTGVAPGNETLTSSPAANPFAVTVVAAPAARVDGEMDTVGRTVNGSTAVLPVVLPTA